MKAKTELIHGESYSFIIDNIFKRGLYTAVDKTFISEDGITICASSEANYIEALGPFLNKKARAIFKVKYEKIDTSKVKLWEVMDAEEWQGVCFYDSVKNEVAGAALVEVYNNNTLYRLVELDWEQSLGNFLVMTEMTESADIRISQSGNVRLGGWLTKKEFFTMCHLVASMTDKPE